MVKIIYFYCHCRHPCQAVEIFEEMLRKERMWLRNFHSTCECFIISNCYYNFHSMKNISPYLLVHHKLYAMEAFTRAYWQFRLWLFLFLDNFATRIQGTPNPQYLAEVGDIKRLQCAVTRLPPPSITWNKYDHPLKLSDRLRKLNSDKTIKINRVRLNDWGNYSCFVENSFGKINLT